MIDVFIYESQADAADSENERFAEEWRDVPCAPRVGDTIFLRKDLGKSARPIRKVIAVEWFAAGSFDSPSARAGQPTPLHAYVTLESTPPISPATGDANG